MLSDAETAGWVKQFIEKIVGSINLLPNYSYVIIWVMFVLIISIIIPLLVFILIEIIFFTIKPPSLIECAEKIVVKQITSTRQAHNEIEIGKRDPDIEYFKTLRNHRQDIIRRLLCTIEDMLFYISPLKGKQDDFRVAIFIFSDNREESPQKLIPFTKGDNEIWEFSNTDFKVHDSKTDNSKKGYAGACAARKESVMGCPVTCFGLIESKLYKVDRAGKGKDRSYLCLPLFGANQHKNELLGVLSIDSGCKKDFSAALQRRRKEQFTKHLRPVLLLLEVDLSIWYTYFRIVNNAMKKEKNPDTTGF